MFVLSVKIIHFLKENMTNIEWLVEMTQNGTVTDEDMFILISNLYHSMEKKESNKLEANKFIISELAVATKRISELEEQVKLLLNKKEG